MNNRPEERITEELLELYLDGQLSSNAMSDLEAKLRSDKDAAGLVAAQQDIDRRLRAIFAPPVVSRDQMEAIIASRAGEVVIQQSSVSTHRRRWILVLATLAAGVAWACVIWQSGRRELEPYFEPRPLVAIYQETVEAGFRPYYFCEDEERFALTFAKRQQVPLRLSAMPDDRRMIGLSYLGGLSRNTTAMLCRFGEQPVIVFIDQQKFDDLALATVESKTDFHVHRSELDGLVIYEVSPFEEPKFSAFLEVR